MSPGRRQQGFTLLELMLAVAIFALLSVMAYSGLRAILDGRESIEAHQQELGRLQMAMTLLSRDLLQFQARPVRDGFGSPLDPLVTAPSNLPQLELTRGGWRNPLQEPRAELQRVAYHIEEGALMRWYWPVLDRAQDSQPRRSQLLEGMIGLEIRLLDEKQKWHTQWPPQQQDPDATPPLLKAIEITLETQHWGSIKRLFPLEGRS